MRGVTNPWEGMHKTLGNPAHEILNHYCTKIPIHMCTPHARRTYERTPHVRTRTHTPRTHVASLRGQEGSRPDGWDGTLSASRVCVLLRFFACCGENFYQNQTHNFTCCNRPFPPCRYPRRSFPLLNLCWLVNNQSYAGLRAQSGGGDHCV